MSDRERSRLGSARKAAAGLTAAAAAAYGVYLLGATGGLRMPVTELRNALGLRIEYVPWNDLYYAYYFRPGRGRPIVLLHSINAVASAHEMRPLVERVRRDTERPLYVLEWLGFGHSDRPDLAYTPALLEDQLEHWLAEVVRPGGADVIALSLGATYAAEVARRRPELVRSLVAIEPAGIDAGPGTIGRGWSRVLFTLPGVQRAFYDRLTSPDALRRFARSRLFSSGFEVPDDFVDSGVETARVEGAARPLDDFLKGRLFPAHAAESFARMRQPLLVVLGTAAERGWDTTGVMPELEDRPNVSVLRLPTGPLPHWERPAEVAERVAAFVAAPVVSVPTSA